MPRIIKLIYSGRDMVSSKTQTSVLFNLLLYQMFRYLTDDILDTDFTLEVNSAIYFLSEILTIIL